MPKLLGLRESVRGGGGELGGRKGLLCWHPAWEDSTGALLGCAVAAQERDDVALLVFDGVFEGSLSFAALQGMRGGARKSASGTLALPVFGRHISPARYQQLHHLKTTMDCGGDERGLVAVRVASTLN